MNGPELPLTPSGATTRTSHIMQGRVLWPGAFFAAESVAIVAVFQGPASVECRLTEIETGCRGLRGLAWLAPGCAGAGAASGHLLSGMCCSSDVKRPA